MKAFPTNKTLLLQDDNEKVYVQSFENLGMDLRDYMAAKAMQSLLRYYPEHLLTATASEVANDSYAMADAMLKVREIHG